MVSGKRFSSFLVRFLVLFEGISLTLVVGLLYGFLSQSMTREFENGLLVEQARTSMALQDRFNRLETRLRELSLDNVVRVSLMLGVRAQLREVLEKRFPPGDGAVYLVQDAGTSAFVPELHGIPEPLQRFMKESGPGSGPASVRFADFEGTAYSAYTLPIRRQAETLGYAHLVYDMARDYELWRRLDKKSLLNLVFWQDSGPVALQGGSIPPADQWPPLSELTRMGSGAKTIGDTCFLQVEEFPGLYFVASTAPLKEEKRKLILFLLGLCSVVFLGTILVAVVIGRKVNEPLEDLANQALEVARKPADVFLAKEKGRYLEFQNLAEAFNQVLVFLLEAQEKLRKKAVLELYASEERFRKTFEISPYSVTISRIEDGLFLQVNEAFARLSGYSREEAVGRTVHDIHLIPNLEERDRFVRILKEQGEVNDLEIQYRTKDGRTLDTILSARPLVYEGQECLVAVVVDITERKRAEKEKETLEQQLRHSQKMEAVGTLAGGIAHDFNNLLQAVQGYADLLRIRIGEGDPGWAELNEISMAAQRASRLTQQLLTFSRKGESLLRPLDLNHEIRHVHKLLQRTIPKMIAIELDLEDDLSAVYADSAQVEQVMINLGLNARDAMPNGGTLRIRTRNVSLARGEPGVPLDLQPGGYVLLTLSDTGDGMDPETREHIFEPFYTTKETGKGTGLGLAMVYGIVKNHNGAVQCESSLGKGSTFSLYFPAVKMSATVQEGTETPASSPVGRGETILVVDDEEPVRELAPRILTHFGYRALTASNAEKAIEIFSKNPEGIDLVILDLIMPGMGGARCVEELLRIDPDARILISSGYFKEGGTAPSLNFKPNGFLPKPYDTRRLLFEVRKALEGAPRIFSA